MAMAAKVAPSMGRNREKLPVSSTGRIMPVMGARTTEEDILGQKISSANQQWHNATDDAKKAHQHADNKADGK